MATYTNPVGGSQAGTKLWDADAVPYSGGSAYSRSFGGSRGRNRHTAVDIPGRVGDPILAVDNGVIRGARNQGGGYGYLVDIEYPDGTVHRAAHLDSMPPVEVGQEVPAGTVIGYLGHSGNAKASFPHAHYEVINKPYYDASPTLTDKNGNVIGNAPPGRASRGELAVGRQDPRLYFAGYRGPDAVARFQREAQAGGYYDGEIDGIAGPGTEGALEQMASAGAIGGLVGSPGPTPQAPQTAQSAIASLQPPAGGTRTATPPSPLQGFQPTIPAGDFGSPAQAAISDLISAPSTASDVDKLAGVMLAEARGEGREGMAGVGNVVLNRANATGNRFPKTIDGVINNEFAKPLGPNDVSPDEWVEARTLATQLQNGAIPDNTGGAVYFANTATASPNAYAEITASGPVSTTIGNHTYHVDAGIGPVARGAPRLDPPALRPGGGGTSPVPRGPAPAGIPVPVPRPGNFDWLGGGAPDAGLVPTPGISPLRPAMGGPGDRRPQPPAPPYDPRRGPLSPVDAFSAPAGPLDLIPYSTQPRAAAAPAIPGLDRSIIAGGNFGTPETAMSLERTFPPLPVAASSPWMDPSRAFDIPPPLSRMADSPPPVRPTITPDFDFAAGPGPTFTPPSLAPDIRGRPEFPGSLPAAPPPLATAAADPWAAAYGSQPVPPPSPTPSPPSISMSDFDVRFGPTQPTQPTGETLIMPGSQAGASGVMEDEPLIASPPPMDVIIGEAGLGTPGQIRRSDPNRQPGFFGRIFGGPSGGGGFGGFGGFIGPNGFFSNAGSFTPTAGSGGSTPFNMQPNGQMGTTRYVHGSVTGNPNMQGTMWNRSGDNGSVGYVTDPFNPSTSMIYSGSPNRF